MNHLSTFVNYNENSNIENCRLSEELCKTRKCVCKQCRIMYNFAQTILQNTPVRNCLQASLSK